MLKKDIKIEIVNIDNYIKKIKGIKNKSNSLIKLFELLKKVKKILLTSKIKEDLKRIDDGLILLYIVIRKELKICQ